MEKSYRIYYTIKMNSKEDAYNINILAKNQKEACDTVKREVYTKTGRNAFRPTTKPYKDAVEGMPPKKIGWSLPE